jgi:hypothetical protein
MTHARTFAKSPCAAAHARARARIAMISGLGGAGMDRAVDTILQ